MLPTFSNHEEYHARQQELALWLPAVRAICQRHRLPTGDLVRLSEGTNIVVAVGEERIIKLYPPFWRREFTADRDVAQYLRGKLAVRTPEIIASGELEGYGYTVMDRLPGRYLAEIWDGLLPEAQTALAAEVGQLVSDIHALPTQPLAHLREDWPAFVARRSAGCVERHRAQGLDEQWLAQIPDYLGRAAPLHPPEFRPALVSADIHQQHLLVQRVGVSWRLCGLFDFDDARVGFPEYDLAATALFLFWGRPAALRTFLLTYGYREEHLGRPLRTRLMAYTLLHRYRTLCWVLRDILGDPPCTTFDELADLIYST